MCFVVIINYATHFLIQFLLVYSLKELKNKTNKQEGLNTRTQNFIEIRYDLTPNWKGDIHRTLAVYMVD